MIRSRPAEAQAGAKFVWCLIAWRVADVKSERLEVTLMRVTLKSAMVCKTADNMLSD